ncbi:uncharacterized protein CLUP02_07192 [Colletotrichum lupini]|uniref:Uncharacterized protein n=1 Tax=Colletotrichum lupini TaxID=145971 RepID=A0A9Q8SQN4_9PEZI|nr:uncharacterized protein CLUP02_07192 [Colletotrichum lupini]UQC81706.1 hypothetical protein CLUP02_07192 [Colletotrichum lupini]
MDEAEGQDHIYSGKYCGMLSSTLGTPIATLDDPMFVGDACHHHLKPMSLIYAKLFEQKKRHQS